MMLHKGKPAHLDIELDWIIARAAIQAGATERRINALENAMALIAERWRYFGPIVTVRDVRVSETTQGRLLAWLDASDSIDPAAEKRLLPYASTAIVSSDVPDGFVRLLLEGSVE
jgi:hypothetical protein